MMGVDIGDDPLLNLLDLLFQEGDMQQRGVENVLSGVAKGSESKKLSAATCCNRRAVEDHRSH